MIVVLLAGPVSIATPDADLQSELSTLLDEVRRFDTARNERAVPPLHGPLYQAQLAEILTEARRHNPLIAVVAEQANQTGLPPPTVTVQTPEGSLPSGTDIRRLLTGRLLARVDNVSRAVAPLHLWSARARYLLRANRQLHDEMRALLATLRAIMSEAASTEKAEAEAKAEAKAEMEQKLLAKLEALNDALHRAAAEPLPSPCPRPNAAAPPAPPPYVTPPPPRSPPSPPARQPPPPPPGDRTRPSYSPFKRKRLRPQPGGLQPHRV